MTDEEAIFAYIDGELEGEELARIVAAIDADPGLQAIVAKHRALTARLQGAFSTVLEAPVPTALSAAVTTRADVVSLAETRSRREQRRLSWGVSQWAAMAATLVAGLIGGVVAGGGDGGLVADRGGQLVASGQFEFALNTQLASSQSAEAPVRIGLTFRNHEGMICRSFTAQAAEGVACRKGKAWQLQGLLGRGHGSTSTGDYRMAASAGTSELVDSLIAGDAMDQAQEQAALAAGWAPMKGP